jgi:[protein-PII] uridylyltransferase
VHRPTVRSPIAQLKKDREGLVARFLKGNDAGFYEENALLLDDYFRDSFANSAVGPQLGVEKNPCAIVALGGYGRKEQCICSDVDVLLLFKKRIPEKAKDLIQEIIYPLWDTGLEVGYATRSLKECSALASQDFEVLTSLIDGRFICGISSLYSDLMEKLRQKVLRRHGRVYINWLSKKNADRHNRFGDSTYRLEPNLKEGLGGLRDFHAMLWAGRAAYNIVEPRDLEFFGHLSHEEFASLTEALSFIRNVRNWLHHMSGRKCDQLYFEYQIKLADALNFEATNGQQPVERFLGTLHKQMDFLKRQHMVFLDGATRKKKSYLRKKPRMRNVSTGIVLTNDTLHFESPEAILKNPLLLVRIFEKSATFKKPLCVAATRLVKEFLYLVDSKFRKSKTVIKSFKTIISSSPQDFNVLNEMLNTGMLTALIPEMHGVVDRIQYDEYHLYPVDKHLLRTVQILKELRDATAESNDAFYADIFKEIRNPELLLWAGLLHDAGKDGHSPNLEDHADRGADMVEQVFNRMGFSDEDIASIAFLVREHLFLIHTATRRDIHDEQTVVKCARKFPDKDHLKMLYLLTVADCKATGPKAWSGWSAAILKELFFKVNRILEAGELGSSAVADMVAKKQQEVQKGASSIPKDTLDYLFDQFSPRYLLYTPSQDIIRHIDLFEKLDDALCALETQIDPRTDSRTVTVCAKDFPGLFSKIAGVLTLNNMDILSAQIYTWRNRIALDVFQVRPPADRIREKEIWERMDNDLRAVLKEEFDLFAALEKKIQVYQTTPQKTPRRADNIVFDNTTSDFFSIIEVYTHDFPGLLYKVTNALFQCELDICFAKIGTKADQVVDVFYVRDFEGQKIDDPDQISVIKAFIQGVLLAGRPN